MKIIEPSAELIKQTGLDMISHIANIARVCYGKDVDGNNPSPTGGLDKDSNLIKRLLDSKHNSVFRHWVHYFVVPKDSIDGVVFYNIWSMNPYIRAGYDKDNFYISFNHNFAIDHKNYFNRLRRYEVSYEHFSNTEVGFQFCWLTFKCITQISTSREFNRVSPNNIIERSTRYCHEDGEIVRPHWFKDNSPVEGEYLAMCQRGFRNYHKLIELGLQKQDARGVLPLDTKTVVVYTYPIDIWKSIIDNRYYGKTGKPHGNAEVLAGLIRNNINQLGYNL